MYKIISPPIRALIKEVSRYNSFLDLGCGKSTPLDGLSKYVRFSIGIDLYLPYLLESKKNGVHNDYVLADVRFLPLKSKCFSVVAAFDLIEHLDKKDGLNVLTEMERIARRKILITTPNGFVQQGEQNGVIFQVHRSGYTVEEFKRQGFKVFGYGFKGFEPLRQWRGFIISYLFTHPIVWRSPKIAFCLLCVKELRS